MKYLIFKFFVFNFKWFHLVIQLVHIPYRPVSSDSKSWEFGLWLKRNNFKQYVLKLSYSKLNSSADEFPGPGFPTAPARGCVVAPRRGPPHSNKNHNWIIWKQTKRCDVTLEVNEKAIADQKTDCCPVHLQFKKNYGRKKKQWN